MANILPREISPLSVTMKVLDYPTSYDAYFLNNRFYLPIYIKDRLNIRSAVYQLNCLLTASSIGISFNTILIDHQEGPEYNDSLFINWQHGDITYTNEDGVINVGTDPTVLKGKTFVLTLMPVLDGVGAPGPHNLTSHSDVTITAPTVNQVLTYDGVGEWTNQTPATKNLGELGNVNPGVDGLGPAEDGDVLTWDNSSGAWTYNPIPTQTDNYLGFEYVYQSAVDPPASGKFTYNQGTQTFSIHKTDNKGVDRSTWLTVGFYGEWIFHAGDVTSGKYFPLSRNKAVATDNGTWISYSPVANFVFAVTGIVDTDVLYLTLNDQSLQQISQLDDTTISAPAEGEQLVFTSGSWQNVVVPGGNHVIVGDGVHTDADFELTYDNLGAKLETRYKNTGIAGNVLSWTEDGGPLTIVSAANVSNTPTTFGTNSREFANISTGTSRFSFRTAPLTDAGGWAWMMVIGNMIDSGGSVRWWLWASEGSPTFTPPFTDQNQQHYRSNGTSQGDSLFGQFWDTLAASGTISIAQPNFPIQSQGIPEPAILIANKIDGGNLELWINGTLYSSSSVAVSQNNVIDWRVGDTLVPAFNEMLYLVGEFATFSSALTTGEVGAITAAMRNYFSNIPQILDGNILKYSSAVSKWLPSTLSINDIPDRPSDKVVYGHCYRAKNFANDPGTFDADGAMAFNYFTADGYSVENFLKGTGGYTDVLTTGTIIHFQRLDAVGEYRAFKMTSDLIRVDDPGVKVSFNNPGVWLTPTTPAMVEDSLWKVTFIQSFAPNIGDMLDVTITTPNTNNYIGWNGSDWVNRQVAYSEISGTPTIIPPVTCGHKTKYSNDPPASIGGWSFAAGTLKVYRLVGATTDVQTSFAPGGIVTFFDQGETDHEYAKFKIGVDSVITVVADVIACTNTIQVYNDLTIGDDTRMLVEPPNIDTLADLADTTITGLAEGHLLVYSGSTWENVLASQIKSYGSIYFDENTTETTINTQNVYETLAIGSTLSSRGNNFDMPSASRLRYTGTPARDFRIRCVFTPEGIDNDKIFDFRLFKNGTTAIDPIMTSNTNSDKYTPITLLSDIDLTTNQYIELQFRNTEGDANMIIRHFYLSVEEI